MKLTWYGHVGLAVLFPNEGLVRYLFLRKKPFDGKERISMSPCVLRCCCWEPSTFRLLCGSVIGEVTTTVVR